MKTILFLVLLIAGMGTSGCSTAEQSQTQSDSLSVDTITLPDGTRVDSLKRDTMPAKKDTV
jgi:hypothetical protein